MDERLPLDKEMGQLCVKGPYIQPLCAGSFFEEEITAQLWLLHRAGASPVGFHCSWAWESKLLTSFFMLENNGSPSIMFEITNSQIPQTSTLLLHKFEV
jgi:hypothetical protein